MRRGFTLIEVLIVLAIIITLVALSVVAGGAVKRSAAKKATLTTLKTLDGLMRDYDRAGNRTMLPTADKEKDWVAALLASPSGGEALRRIGVDNGMVRDAFGTPIQWEPEKAVNGQVVTGYFLSAGPDTKIGTADDITSKETETH